MRLFGWSIHRGGCHQPSDCHRTLAYIQAQSDRFEAFWLRESKQNTALARLNDRLGRRTHAQRTKIARLKAMLSQRGAQG